MPFSADVLFADTISSEKAADLLREFEATGVSAGLREVSPRRSIGEIAWLALLTIPAKPFFEELAKNFADDASQQFKTLVGKVLHRGKRAPESPLVLVLQDSATGIQVVLESDLPSEAYAQLLSFDLTTIHQGPLRYDRRQRRWRLECDEQKQSVYG